MLIFQNFHINGTKDDQIKAFYIKAIESRHIEDEKLRKIEC